MSTLIITLVCFAVAFVSGGLLSKAYFLTRSSHQDGQDESPKKSTADNPGEISREELDSLLQAQRVRYRKRIVALNNVIKRHEETRGQIREKLQVI